MQLTSRFAGRTSHPYFMHDCIVDQPVAIRRMLRSQRPNANGLAERIADARHVHLVGIGTSWHAAMVGEYLLRRVGGRDEARAWNSFEFWAYPPTMTNDDVVIVMSHGGTKRYSLWALEQAKKAGARTALITGQNSKGRLDLADVVIETSYQDKSAAFTISHTAAMSALAMVAVEAGGGQDLGAADLEALPDGLSDALALEPQIKAIARQYKNASRIVSTGWGPNVATAHEVALKVNEAVYLPTNAYQLEYFLHGPFVATSEGPLVIFIAPPGAGYQRAVQLAKATRETGAHVLALVQEGDVEMRAVANTTVTLPAVPELLTPIVYLVPLQLLTYWLALELGRNPDLFRWDDPRHVAATKPVEF